MKIVFMGTPDIAVPCLQKIIDEKYEILGVVTQPDKPKGRGKKLGMSPVKELAIEN
ncbi:TPA: methionyl-tRNA formyltransferase, partial [Clostridioides difficile]